MGAINYGTNKILCTIGYMEDSCSYAEEAKKCYMEEEGLTEQEAEEKARDDFYYFEQEDFNMINKLIEKEHFEYYKVSVESGYYEGFYISISDNYWYFDNYAEKKAMQKELTRLANLLKNTIESGMRVCYPWWCTSWDETSEKSLKSLNESVKEERERIKSIPTDWVLNHKMTKEQRKELGCWW